MNVCEGPQSVQHCEWWLYIEKQKEMPATYGQSMSPFESRQKAGKKLRIAKRNRRTNTQQSHPHTPSLFLFPSLPSSLPSLFLSVLVANSVNVSGDKDVSFAFVTKNRKNCSAFFQVNLKHTLRLRYQLPLAHTHTHTHKHPHTHRQQT